MTKKLFSNIILGIIGALAIALILMAIIPKSFSVGVSEKPYQITVYGTNTSSVERYVNDKTMKEQYNKLSNLYIKSFSTSSLNALFTKNIGYNAQYEYDGTDYLSKLVSQEDRIVMEFKYNKLQTLKQGSKDYVNDAIKNLHNSNYENGVVKYKEVWISIQDTKGFQEVEFYFAKLQNNGEYIDSNNTTILKVTTLADTHELYTELKKVQSKIK